MRVLIADSQRLFADALATALSADGEISVIDDQPTTGLETLRAVVLTAPEVLILDYWITGMTGPACAKAILHRCVVTKIIFLSWFHTRQDVQVAFAAGASEFLGKSVPLKRLGEVVKAVHGGQHRPQTGSPNGVTGANGHGQELFDPAIERLMSLTPREIEILSLLSFAPMEKVASTLSLARGTVRNHVFNILRKTQTRSQIEAISMARRYGLIDS